MKITNANVMKFESNAGERATIDMAREFLRGIIQHLEKTCGNYGEGITLYDPTTGEIVQEEELARARAVLDFFYEDRILEIQC